MFEQIIAAAERLSRRARRAGGRAPRRRAELLLGLDVVSIMAAGGGLDGLADRVRGEVPNWFQRAAYDWLELPMPVIAALHGNCFGGGLQIALGADIRIAAPDARLSVMEVKWGLVPDMSITRTLPRLVCIDVAKELTYTGRVFDGDEAARLGVVTRVADDPLAAARELAAEIAARSPDAVRAAKRLYDESWTGDARADAGARGRASAGADRLAQSARGRRRRVHQGTRRVRRPLSRVVAGPVEDRAQGRLELALGVLDHRRGPPGDVGVGSDQHAAVLAHLA